MKLSIFCLMAVLTSSFSAFSQINPDNRNIWDKVFHKNPVSMRKNNDVCFVQAEKMLPRGSALITTSGDMNKEGISAIIHAATGAMTKSDGEFEPTVDSIKNSIKNSFILARRYKHKRVAVPFLGGGIFASRMGVTKEELADIIISAALKNQRKLEVVFVLFTAAEETIFRDTLANYTNAKNASVVKGSITEFDIHKATAIVNAANMEVIFGGGISGAIGSASGQADQIDAEAAEAVSRVAQACNETRPDTDQI
jgi:O-acetyl-ADP-ribose deacetylase (regulator of RNase III)